MTARTPTEEDFYMVFDDKHTYQFFEDENANYLWALGTLDDAEFVRQVNEYDMLCWAPEVPEPLYTEKDVEHLFAVIENRVGDTAYDFVEPVPEGTENSVSIVRISR